MRPEITTLGAWMNAGKLRFIDFFPTDMEIATHGELSVEFYHHIYNLLGDPELNFHKGPMTAMTAVHAADLAGRRQLPAGRRRRRPAAAPLAGARVGVVQDGQLLGSGFTGDDGVAHAGPVAGRGRRHAAAHRDRLRAGCPVRATIAVGAAPDGSLNVASVVVDDDDTAPSSGDGNHLAGPGETLGLLPTLVNRGAAASAAAALTLTLRGTGHGR